MGLDMCICVCVCVCVCVFVCVCVYVFICFPHSPQFTAHLLGPVRMCKPSHLMHGKVHYTCTGTTTSACDALHPTWPGTYQTGWGRRGGGKRLCHRKERMIKCSQGVCGCVTCLQLQIWCLKPL